MIGLGDHYQLLQWCKQENKQLTTVKNYWAVIPPGNCGEIINYKSRAQVALYSHHNAAMEL